MTIELAFVLIVYILSAFFYFRFVGKNIKRMQDTRRDRRDLRWTNGTAIIYGIFALIPVLNTICAIIEFLQFEKRYKWFDRDCKL